MQVSWSYDLDLQKITAYPMDNAVISARASLWSAICSHSSSGVGLSSFVLGAKGFVEIHPRKTALDILSNMMEKGANVSKSGFSNGKVAFANFWFDPVSTDVASCSLVIGLSDSDFKAVCEDFKFSAAHGFPVRIQARSGFSDVAGNPHSSSPTAEQFELGYPTVLDDLSISLIFPEKGARRSEDVTQ